jgi:hypothetical protein
MDSGWVVFGYVVTYGTLVAYGASLLFRRRRTSDPD